MTFWNVDSGITLDAFTRKVAHTGMTGEKGGRDVQTSEK